MSEIIVCWKCGKDLSSLPKDFSRTEECIHCGCEVRVCKMCKFYDPKLQNSCREPIADDVTNKERANFCDYFKVSPGAFKPKSGASQTAMDGLSDLFGGVEVNSAPSAEDAKKKLDELFGK